MDLSTTRGPDQSIMPAVPQPKISRRVATTRMNDGAPASLTAEGDCCVVVNSRGECWDGKGWVAGWGRAVQFRRPAPAYEMCEEAAREAERVTGVAGLVCYILPGTLPSAVLDAFPDLSGVDLREFSRPPVPAE